MVRRRFITAVFHKEMLDTIRDKKTILINLALPVVIWPVMAMFVTQYTASHISRQKEKISRVALAGHPILSLREALKSREKIEIVTLDSEPYLDVNILDRVSASVIDVTEPAGDVEQSADTVSASFLKTIEALIETKTVDAVIAQKSVVTDSAGSQNFKVWILYDGTNQVSVQAGERIQSILDDLADELLVKRLAEADLDNDYIRPLERTLKNVASPSKTVGDLVGRVLPLLLIFLVVLGGFYPAITMTAGEKEYGTLPTVLCAPINHLELLIGKYLAIMVIALTGVIANLLSLSSVLLFGIGDASLNISGTVVLVIFVVLVPTAMLYTALFMCVAIFADSFREGQNLLSPVTLIAIIPAYAALLPGFEVNVFTAITPGFNIALLIKEILVKTVNPEFVVLTLLANLAWTAVFLMSAARLFAAEQVVLGGKVGIGDIFTFDRDGLPGPDPRLSTILFLIFLSGTFYLSGILLRFGITVLVPVLQLGMFVAVPLLIAIYFRMNLTEVFRLNRPPLAAAFGAVLLGSTLFVGTSWLARLTPPPAEYQGLLVEALQLNDTTISFPLLLILIAVLPGICEEVAFRGIILSGYLNGLRGKWAVVLTGFLFACAHFSIYNLIPLTFMGILLSYSAWRTRSIWVGIIIHVLNNGLAVSFTRYEEFFTNRLGLHEDTIGSPAVLAAATGISIIGLFCIHISGRTK